METLFPSHAVSDPFVKKGIDDIALALYNKENYDAGEAKPAVFLLYNQGPSHPFMNTSRLEKISSDTLVVFELADYDERNGNYLLKMSFSSPSSHHAGYMTLRGEGDSLEIIGTATYNGSSFVKDSSADALSYARSFVENIPLHSLVNSRITSQQATVDSFASWLAPPSPVSAHNDATFSYTTFPLLSVLTLYILFKKLKNR